MTDIPLAYACSDPRDIAHRAEHHKLALKRLQELRASYGDDPTRAEAEAAMRRAQLVIGRLLAALDLDDVIDELHVIQQWSER